MSDLPSIHQNALKNTLDILGVSFEAFIEVVLKTSSVDPAEILGSILDKKADEVNLSDEQLEAAVEILDASLLFDYGTGAYDRKHRPMIEAAGDVIATNTDKEVFKVQIDLSNMGGANEAVGRDNVDDMVRIITEIYNDALSENADVVPSRDGGDEIGFVVVGGDEENIEKSIKRAQDRVEEFIRDVGLDTLIHLKYPDIEERRGFSAGAGYAPLGVGLNEEEIQQNIDIGIELEKLERGKERFALSQAELKKSHNSRLLPSDFHYHDADNEEDEIRRKVNLENIPAIIDDFRAGELLAEILPDISNENRDWSESAFPTSQREGVLLENPETLRLEAIINQVERLDLELEQVLLFTNLTELYDERDPLTGLKGTRDFIKDIDRINQSGTGSILAVVEVENLSGLNEARGHYASDVVIASAASAVEQRISDEYGENQTNDMYHIGAGRVAIILPINMVDDATLIDREQERLQEVIAEAAKDFNRKVNIDGVEDIPHPKREDMVGTGLAYVTVQLELEKAAEQYMRDIDIIREYEYNKDLEVDKITAEVKKDHVDRRTFNATWTIASRGETREIERSLDRDEREAEAKTEKSPEEVIANLKNINRQLRRKRPRLQSSYTKLYKEEKERDKNNENSR